ncbi:MAG: glycosyl hydrolase family 18 protein [Halanaerobium sp.]|nr:glycosyl hydrolase family 18 protein [Halanaerobium sp.]
MVNNLDYWLYMMPGHLDTFPRSRIFSGIVVAAGVVGVRGDLSVNLAEMADWSSRYGDLLLLIQNKNFSREIADKFLASDEARSRFIQQVQDLLSSTSFTGVNLDLEMVSASSRDNLNSLVREMREEFAGNGSTLSISVPAKSSDNPGNNWNGAFDYSQLGSYCDRVMIMAYDFHWSGGPPGFISPLSWVRDVIDYAILEVPPEKIILGLPAYGYDWPAGEENRAKGLSYNQVIKLALKYGVPQNWDQEEGENFFTYPGEDGIHNVYYHNRKSLKARCKLVLDYQLAGIIIWRWGLEDLSFWEEVLPYKEINL